MHIDVMCVGEMVIDFTPGKEKDSYIRNAGGAPANVAIALSRFGNAAAFCGKLGNDDFGRFLIKTLRDDNVKVLLDELTDDAVTTMAFVTLTEDGERSFTFARKPGADMLLEPDDIDVAHIQNATMIHAGSCSLSKGTAREATKFAVELANRHHKLVSFDLNYRNLLWDSEDEAKKQIKSILPYVDLLKVSDEEINLIGGEEHISNIMNEADISVVILTRGSSGSSVYFNGNEQSIAAMKVDVADTNGAGDAFWGGFLSSLLAQNVVATTDISDSILINALRFGTVAGGLAVQKYGAIPALPTKTQVDETLETLVDGGQLC